MIQHIALLSVIAVTMAAQADPVLKKGFRNYNSTPQGRAWTYRIQRAPYAADLGKRMAHAAGAGVVSETFDNDGKVTLECHNGTIQYAPKVGAYAYRNDTPPAAVKAGKFTEAKLKKAADEVVRTIVGSKGPAHKLVRVDKDVSYFKDVPEGVLNERVYVYNQIVDNRYIVGNAGRIKVGLNEYGEVRSIRYRPVEAIKHRQLGKQVRRDNANVRKRLKKAVDEIAFQRGPGNKGKAKGVVCRKGVASFGVVDGVDGQYLKPQLTFVAEADILGETRTLVLHISEDAAAYPSSMKLESIGHGRTKE
jgi:hypothetical protein